MIPSDFPIVRRLAARSLLGVGVWRALSVLDAAYGSSRLVRVVRDGTALASSSIPASERLRMVCVAIATGAAVYILAIWRGPAHIHTAMPVLPLIGVATLAACLAGGAESLVRAWPGSALRAVWIRVHRSRSN